MAIILEARTDQDDHGRHDEAEHALVLEIEDGLVIRDLWAADRKYVQRYERALRFAQTDDERSELELKRFNHINNLRGLGKMLPIDRIRREADRIAASDAQSRMGLMDDFSEQRVQEAKARARRK